MDRIGTYHASTVIVENHYAMQVAKALTSGRAFTRPTYAGLATVWALRRAGNSHLLYLLERRKLLKETNVLTFRTYNRAWLDYVVACRKGMPGWKNYDYIEGGVALSTCTLTD